MARAGGSSSTFRMALAADGFMSSAPSTTTTRQPPSAGVRLMKPPIFRASSTMIWVRWRPVFSLTPSSMVSRSACEPAATRRNTGSAGIKGERFSRGHPGQQSAGEAESQRGLADAVRPGDQPGMVQPPGTQRVQDGGLGGLVAEQQLVGAGGGGGHGASIADGVGAGDG